MARFPRRIERRLPCGAPPQAKPAALSERFAKSGASAAVGHASTPASATLVSTNDIGLLAEVTVAPVAAASIINAVAVRLKDDVPVFAAAAAVAALLQYAAS